MKDWICYGCTHLKVYPETRYEPREVICNCKDCDFYMMDGAYDENGERLDSCECFKERRTDDR